VNIETSPLSEGLIHEAELPMRWSIVEAKPTGSEVSRAWRRNGQLLQILLASEDHKSSLLDEQGERSQELQRVEAKLDLLLALVSELVREERAPGQELPLKLGAGGLSWMGSGAAPAPGQYVWIELALDPFLPGPLPLPAKVLEVEKGLEVFTVLAAFVGQDEELRELLQKVLFRYHRRTVARIKAERRS
jgi:hypothetical protein